MTDQVTDEMREPGAVTITEAPVKGEGQAEVVTAESLGVSEAQFAKYYKDGVYNWDAHRTEVEYREKQAKDKDDRQDKAVFPEDIVKPADADVSDGDASKAVEQAGLDWDTLDTEIATDGKLGEASVEALKALGIPENVITTYVDNIVRDAEAHIDNVTKAFGGEDTMAKVNEWVVTNLAEAEIETYNERLNDPAQFDSAVKELLDKSGAKVTKAPEKRLEAPNSQIPSSTGPKAFASDAEMQQAFRDPRYRTDAAFRQEVMERVRVTDIRYNPRAHTGGM